MLYRQCPRKEIHEKHYYIYVIREVSNWSLVVHQDLDPDEYNRFIEDFGEQWEVRCLGVRREIKR